MSYLIDTQVFIWSLVSPAKLSAPARHALQTGSSYVSVLSLFEIAIKQKIGKLPELPISTNELAEQLKQDGFQLLPFSQRHVACYDLIPLLPNHRDPFDRALLATAMAERMTLVSADGHFHQYADQVTIVW